MQQFKKDARIDRDMIYTHTFGNVDDGIHGILIPKSLQCIQKIIAIEIELAGLPLSYIHSYQNKHISFIRQLLHATAVTRRQFSQRGIQKSIAVNIQKSPIKREKDSTVQLDFVSYNGFSYIRLYTLVFFSNILLTVSISYFCPCSSGYILKVIFRYKAIQYQFPSKLI